MDTSDLAHMRAALGCGDQVYVALVHPLLGFRQPDQCPLCGFALSFDPTDDRVRSHVSSIALSPA